MTAPVTPPASVPNDLVVDRRAEERTDAALLPTLRVDPSSRVLVVHGDAAPLTSDGRLDLVGVGVVPEDAEWAFLGRAADGSAVLLAAFDSARDAPVAIPGTWGALRSVAGALPAGEASIFVTAVALARWLVDAPFCPACGARTIERDAGWSRRCPSCGRQHFPRTDPAVIVAVTRSDDPDLLLLGSNALWDDNRYSCFAGFAEAGESLEDAVTREVGEEAGVVVEDVVYRGSQGWPYPRSLMLGFRARASVPADARADGEEILAVRWFTRAEIAAGLAGRSELRLPGPASIAHRLISEWLAESA
ncbi:NAD(+) diphosphatase [Microbacterium sp. P06]|uniref:NAD(+) diphosphatase n=1 Tax=unclassified Microbacterium TaxID=2609290 RepID=UPI00374747D1